MTNPKVLRYSQQQHEQPIGLYFSWSSYRLVSAQGREDVSVLFASSDLFQILGVKPHLGRLFDEREQQGNQQPSAVLSYHLWQDKFAGDPAIVGKQIQLNKRAFVVVGIAPQGMTLPQRQDADHGIWLPLDMDEVMNPATFGGYGGAIKGIARVNDDTAQTLANFTQAFVASTQAGAALHTPKMAKPIRFLPE